MSGMDEWGRMNTQKKRDNTTKKWRKIPKIFWNWSIYPGDSFSGVGTQFYPYTWSEPVDPLPDLVFWKAPCIKYVLGVSSPGIMVRRGYIKYYVRKIKKRSNRISVTTSVL